MPAPGDNPWPSDPVLAKRARISRLVSLGQRIGYLALAAAIMLFVVGFITRFTSALTAAVLVLMVIACFVLPPAIVFGYGVKAADAEDRGEKFGY